jgi:hypothetical protein
MSKASMGESPRTVDRNRGQTEGGSESEGPSAWTGPYSRHLSIGQGVVADGGSGGRYRISRDDPGRKDEKGLER